MEPPNEPHIPFPWLRPYY